MRAALEPSRPDEASSQRRPERRWLPVLAVIAVISLITGAGDLVAGGLAGSPGPTVDVGPAVQLHPARGWETEVRHEDGDLHAVLLARGTVVLAVVATPARGVEPGDLLAEYEAGLLSEGFADLTVGEPEMGTLGGLPAVRVGYVGTTTGGAAVEGFVVAVVSATGQGVVFDAAAPSGDLAAAVDDLAAMIEDADVR